MKRQSPKPWDTLLLLAIKISRIFFVSTTHNMGMKKTIQSVFVGTVVGFANGLFGSGGGTLLVPALQKFFKIETHKSHATALTVILPLSILSAFVYIRGDAVDWQTVLWVTVGGVPGGFVGAMLLNKLPASWVHKIFGAFMIAAAVKMITA